MKKLLLFFTVPLMISCNNDRNSTETTSVNSITDTAKLQQETDKTLVSNTENKDTSKPTTTDNVTTPTTPVAPNIPDPGNLNFLKELKGKYASQAKLLQNPELRPRLEKLMEGRFKFMEDTWAVETPIEIRNNIFTAEACEAHNCDRTNFIIVVDFAKNLIYAGIREEGVVKKYSEDGSASRALDTWAKE